ncbi:uncharacterized protein LOC5504175 isoform X2 [Nematostella vectensis]|uniref:uncharacterized protein LOC5504175 isoform X2 n=1 Tax=Nematostella vectensis TaxID=45351 RepID=UPI002077276B|nr:uncharacterized protein LOC5504175 isoform X2 [Nematostella vectensis]
MRNKRATLKSARLAPSRALTGRVGSTSNNSTFSSGGLFSHRKNVIITYSKSKPVQIKSKGQHFLTPDTPQLLTSEEPKTSGKKSSVEPEKLNLKSNADSLQKSVLLHHEGTYNITTSPASFESTKNPPTPQLVLRNISNIPIDKTVGRVCTPGRDSTERRLIPSSHDPANSNSRKRPKRHGKKTKTAKTIVRKPSHDMTKKTKMVISEDLTSYSPKTMSLCTIRGSRYPSYNKDSHMLSAKSMSLEGTRDRFGSGMTYPSVDKKDEDAVESLSDDTIVPSTTSTTRGENTSRESMKGRTTSVILKVDEMAVNTLEDAAPTPSVSNGEPVPRSNNEKELMDRRGASVFARADNKIPEEKGDTTLLSSLSSGRIEEADEGSVEKVNRSADVSEEVVTQQRIVGAKLLPSSISFKEMNIGTDEHGIGEKPRVAKKKKKRAAIVYKVKSQIKAKRETSASSSEQDVRSSSGACLEASLQDMEGGDSLRRERNRVAKGKMLNNRKSMTGLVSKSVSLNASALSTKMKINGEHSGIIRSRDDCTTGTRSDSQLKNRGENNIKNKSSDVSSTNDAPSRIKKAKTKTKQRGKRYIKVTEEVEDMIHRVSNSDNDDRQICRSSQCAALVQGEPPYSVKQCYLKDNKTIIMKSGNSDCTAKQNDSSHDNDKEDNEATKHNKAKVDGIDPSPPKNSTFNEDEGVALKDVFPSDISAIREESVELAQTGNNGSLCGQVVPSPYQKQGGKSAEQGEGSSPKTGKKSYKPVDPRPSAISLETSGGSERSWTENIKTSTPVDGKVPAALGDAFKLSPILPEIQPNQPPGNGMRVNPPARPKKALQESTCLENVTEDEAIPDDITPDIPIPNKRCSSSKRRLQYASPTSDTTPDCFLLSITGAKRKPARVWMRKGSHKQGDIMGDVPQDIIATL